MKKNPGTLKRTWGLDFGGVPTGDFKIKRVSIENVGDASGAYQLVLPAGAFTISDDGANPTNRTLAPGGDADIQVVFRPTAEQQYGTNITFAARGRNACALAGVGDHRFVGPRFQFLTTSLNFAMKQTVNQQQTVVIKNVGDQAGIPNVVNNNSPATRSRAARSRRFRRARAATQWSRVLRHPSAAFRVF